jgi:WD40 repeat protein
MSDPPAPRPILVLHAPSDEAFARGYLAPALGGLGGDGGGDGGSGDGGAGGGGDGGGGDDGGGGAGDAGGVRVMSAPELAALSISELERLIRGSRATISVLTPAFFADPWAQLGEVLAREAAMRGGPDVIPLVLEKLELPAAWRALVRLELWRKKDWGRGMEQLRRQLARAVVPVPRPPCPYPGMRPFRDDESACFHGRAAEIAEVLGRIEAGDRELYVIGASGSGKSSLLTAGVLPRLGAAAGPIVVRALRPGSAPARRLAEALEAPGPGGAGGAGGAGAGTAADTEAADDDPGASDSTAAIGAGIAGLLQCHPAGKIVILVDQLEELFTQADAAQQARFARALRAVRAEPRCLLLFAIRADFYAELLESELWRDGAKRHIDLLPLRGAALRESIEQPARAARVYFERGLIERLQAHAADEPGVLPLLQETLMQLWDRMQERLLTLADYEALGEGGRSGLAVAISSRADRCLQELPGSQGAIARRTLLRLVSFGQGRPNTRRRQPLAALGAGEPADELTAVLRQLAAARLVTLDGDERTGEVAVDLCHEALIAAWPPFAAWVEARRADEQRRRQLQATADEWVARGRGESGLFDAGELAAAEAWRLTDAARELGETPEVTALIDASRRALEATRRHRRRLIGVFVAGLGMFAAVTATLAVIASRQAADARAGRADAEVARAVAETERGIALEQRRAAERLLGEQDRELGRQRVVDGRDDQAIPFLVSARERGADGPMLRSLFHAATKNEPIAALRHRGAVTAASFSRDGARIATASRDRTARVWDARSGAPLTPPLMHPAPVTAARWSPDGARLLTISRDDTARIWDLSAASPPAIPLRHEAPIDVAAFSADGARVLTAGDGTARVWDARSGQPVSPVLAHPHPTIGDAALSPDGGRVVTAGVTSVLWSAATGRRIALLPFSILRAVWSSGGTHLVTACADQTTRLFDGETGALRKTVQHEANVTDLAFGKDDAQVAFAQADGLVTVFDQPGVRLLAHPPSVRRVRFSSDGARLLTEGHDQSVRIWDHTGGTPLAALKLDAGALEAALSPDGTQVVMPGADGIARVFRVAQAPREVGGLVIDGAYSPDGSQLAVLAEGHLQLWSSVGQVLRKVPVHELTERSITWSRVVFSPDGGRIALLSSDYDLQLWNLRTQEVRLVLREPGFLSQQMPLGWPPPSFAFSPDGRHFAVAVAAQVARVHDSDTGAPMSPLLVHTGRLTSIRFAPDGRVIASSADGTVRQWDAATGQPAGPALAHPPGVGVVAAVLGPGGARIATIGGDQIVRVWDAASGRLLAQLEHGGEVRAAVFSPDGARILTSCYDRSVRLWDVASGEPAAPPIAPGKLVIGAFSPDGARIATRAESEIQLWDAATSRPITAPLVHPAPVRAMAFGPDGASLLTLAGSQLRIWDVGLDARTLEEWRALADRGALRRTAP